MSVNGGVGGNWLKIAIHIIWGSFLFVFQAKIQNSKRPHKTLKSIIWCKFVTRLENNLRMATRKISVSPGVCRASCGRKSCLFSFTKVFRWIRKFCGKSLLVWINELSMGEEKCQLIWVAPLLLRIKLSQNVSPWYLRFCLSSKIEAGKGSKHNVLKVSQLFSCPI